MDLIDRRAAIDTLEYSAELCKAALDNLDYDSTPWDIRLKQINDDIDAIKDLPSAQEVRMMSDFEKLINASDLIEWIMEAYADWCEYPVRGIVDHINEMPSAQRTGRWIWDDESYHCSECFFHASGNTLECMDGTYKYCPNCGAKMEVEHEQEH